MLEKTFIHVSGVGSELERSLWDQGCGSWKDFLAGSDNYSCGILEKAAFTRTLKRSIKALEDGEHQFFRKKLGLKDSWRAFPDFRHSCVYLDIETDGRNRGDSITTIGLYDGKSFRGLVKGDDLGSFPDLISNYSMIVTYYGAGFDLPVLQKRFPLTRLDQIHIDLCPILKRLGHQGGLKKIEKQVGITRSPETDGLTGRDAIFLWRKYLQLGDDRALETLIAYNREDVVNLEKLAEYAYAKLWDQTYGSRLPL